MYTIQGGLMLMVWMIAYFIPYIIAKSKKRDNTQAIFWLNALLGWTLIGWLIALFWALTNSKKSEVEQMRELIREMKAMDKQ